MTRGPMQNAPGYRHAPHGGWIGTVTRHAERGGTQETKARHAEHGGTQTRSLRHSHRDGPPIQVHGCAEDAPRRVPVVRLQQEVAVRAHVAGKNEDAVRANVRASCDHLRHGSRLLEELVLAGRVLVVGAEYELDTGIVQFFDGVPA